MVNIDCIMNVEPLAVHIAKRFYLRENVIPGFMCNVFAFTFVFILYVNYIEY